MADENIVRSYRSVGPVRRPSEPMPVREAGTRDVGARDVGARDGEPRSDPLAELARLIGQSDPFADPPPTSARSRAPASPSQPRADSAPASDWRATAAALAREAMRNPPMDDPPYEDADAQVDRIHSAIADIDSYRSDSYRSDSYRSGSDSHYAEPEYAPVEEEHDAGHAYDAGHHYDTGHHYDDAGHRDHEQQYFDASEESSYAEAPTAQPRAHDEPNYFFDGEAPPADERFYDDPPRARHGNGLVTAAVLVGCALLGTAGAYGYRSYYAGARSTDAPIIVADPTPSRVVPSTASVVPGQQQVADKGADEQIVTHQ